MFSTNINKNSKEAVPRKTKQNGQCTLLVGYILTLYV